MRGRDHAGSVIDLHLGYTPMGPPRPARNPQMASDRGLSSHWVAKRAKAGVGALKKFSWETDQ